MDRGTVTETKNYYEYRVIWSYTLFNLGTFHMHGLQLPEFWTVSILAGDSRNGSPHLRALQLDKADREEPNISVSWKKTDAAGYYGICFYHCVHTFKLLPAFC